VIEHANRAVLLSPHIDDVPFSLGAALMDGRFPCATIVNIFSVSRSSFDDDDVGRVTSARRIEDQRFFQNISHPIERLYLNRLDAPLRLAITDDDVCAVSPSASDEGEVNSIRRLLDAIRPGRALLIAPLALGGHVDHVVVHRAACAAALDGWRVAFYEDAPYAFDLRLENIQRVADEASAQLGCRFEPCILPCEHAGCSKEEAIGVYKSQLGPTTVFRVLGHSRRLGGVAERIWCAG
jgi:hypothetical protein